MDRHGFLPTRPISPIQPVAVAQSRRKTHPPGFPQLHSQDGLNPWLAGQHSVILFLCIITKGAGMARPSGNVHLSTVVSRRAIQSSYALPILHQSQAMLLVVFPSGGQPSPPSHPLVSPPFLRCRCCALRALLCGLRYASSVLSSNTGKAILNQFRYPATLTFVQFGFVAVY
jgi:hypothetical protein